MAVRTFIVTVRPAEKCQMTALVSSAPSFVRALLPLDRDHDLDTSPTPSPTSSSDVLRIY